MKQPSYLLVVNGTKVLRPVFVLGAPHSGVDLLAHALRHAPGFHLTAARPSVTSAAYAFARRPSIAEEHGTGAASVLRDALAEAWQLTPHTCPVCSNERVSIRAAAEPCRHARSVERFADATPELLHSAIALSTAFEDALFIQIIRDGRDVVADMLDDEESLSCFRAGMATVTDELPNPFFGIDSEAERERFAELSLAAKCALRWRGAVRQSARLRQNLAPDRLMTLRYEELIGGEAASAERLTAFIGATLPATELMRAAPGIGAWRARLTPSQRADVDSTARAELVRLGYR